LRFLKFAKYYEYEQLQKHHYLGLEDRYSNKDE
jgi:hypothetical protein